MGLGRVDETFGRVRAVRYGFETTEQFRDALAFSAASLDEKPGRVWRNTEDTDVSAPVREEMWLTTTGVATMITMQRENSCGSMLTSSIRKLTNGQKSLHDFCLNFLAKGGNTGPITVSYDFDELVSDLNQVVPYD
jgi:predicted metalloprotease with PDZ domain